MPLGVLPLGTRGRCFISVDGQLERIAHLAISVLHRDPDPAGRRYLVRRNDDP